MIIPSIDILDGKAVRLRQGKDKVYETEDIFGLLNKYVLFREINVIDLNGAFGTGSNIGIIKELCKLTECNVGGGLRTVERAQDYLECGAKSVIIGTMAKKEFLRRLPREKVIVAIDTKDGKIAVNGWRELVDGDIASIMRETEEYCHRFLVTDVNVEGMNNGANLKFFESLKGVTKNGITVAGGITTLGEVNAINKMGFDEVLGMALSSGTLDVMDCFSELVDFDKGGGLVPTIVQDVNTSEVLMLAYSDRASLRKTYTSSLATYYSRSRGRLWTKGETSGNTQEIKKILLDCDGDTLLFMVDQKGNACHKNTRTCFDG